MSTMILEVYDALKAAGAPEEKVQAAATVLAQTDNRFDKIDSELAATKLDLAVVKAELALVKWIVSGIGFGVVLLILKSFWPSP